VILLVRNFEDMPGKIFLPPNQRLIGRRRKILRDQAIFSIVVMTREANYAGLIIKQSEFQKFFGELSKILTFTQENDLPI
jgi:hypothetical protein